MKIHLHRGCLLGLMILLGGVLGCGAREYKKRLETRVERLKGQSSQDLGAPVALGDTRVTVRIPKIFGDPPRPCADAARIAIPGLEKVTDKAAFGYEAMLPIGDDPAAGTASCSLRFWVRPGVREEMSGTIWFWLRDFFPDSELKPVALRTDRGNESLWSAVTVESKQKFFVSVGGQEESKMQDGRVAVYVYKAPDNSVQILMTLCAPKVLWDKHNLKNLADQTAGCLTVPSANAAQ